MASHRIPDADRAPGDDVAGINAGTNAGTTDRPDRTDPRTPSHTGAAGPRWARALVLVLPALWLGLIVGISLIEAPLKFTAPGITIPLGLGIGRRVFFAMNLTEIVLALGLVLALWRSFGSLTRPAVSLIGLAGVAVLAVKTVVIRPLLNQRTDAVLAGVSEGGSATHYVYIAADGLLIVLLVALLVAATRTLLTPQR